MRIFTTLFILISSQLIYAQVSTPYRYLDTNNANVNITGRGHVGHNFAFNSQSYEIPKGSGNHTLFEISPIWSGQIGAEIKGSFQPYNLSGNMMGPVSNDYSDTWHQDTRVLYSIPESVANNHMNNWNQSGYTTPQSIQDWPGNGNTSIGTDLFIAPFEDVNGNMEYDPSNGDYPLVKGDDNVFSIYHYDSIYATTPNSVGENYPLEVRQLTYQYVTNDARNNTTYMRYIVVNRGANTLENFKFGLFVDFDLGGPNDDYVGTDSIRNMFYVYNADNLDADDGAQGYQSNPPAFGVKVLNNNLHATNNVLHSAITDITTLSSLNYMMDGLYANGAPVMNSNSNQIKMIYKGDPNVSGSESEIQLSNTPGDKRSIISMSPVNIGPNEYICYDIALVYGQGTNNLNSVAELQNAADEIQTFYDNGQNSCWTPPAFLSVEEKEENQIEAKIYPNPFENSFIIENATTIENIEIININGQTVKTLSPNQKYTQINTTTLSPGMYFVKITDERNNLKTYRVIKR